jgi:hypothetical protein
MFYIQCEEDLGGVASVQLDDDGDFGVIATTPGVTTSEYNRVVVHIQGNPPINGNNVAATDNAIYLVSKDNGSYSINQVGEH